nr:hypothetical protein CFP56_44610 [Quercus suber]
MPEQSQSVTEDRDESIENRKDDTALKVRINEGITVELTVLEANIEELCLAKEFGAATLQRSGKKSTKNTSSRATLSNPPQLKKSRDTQVARARRTDSIRIAPPW